MVGQRTSDMILGPRIDASFYNYGFCASVHPANGRSKGKKGPRPMELKVRFVFDVYSLPSLICAEIPSPCPKPTLKTASGETETSFSPAPTPSSLS